MSDGHALSKEALETLLSNTMAVYGGGGPQITFVGASIFTKRESRLAFGLKIPLGMMIEEDCQYIEIGA